MSHHSVLGDTPNWTHSANFRCLLADLPHLSSDRESCSNFFFRGFLFLWAAFSISSWLVIGFKTSTLRNLRGKESPSSLSSWPSGPIDYLLNFLKYPTSLSRSIRCSHPWFRALGRRAWYYRRNFEISTAISLAGFFIPPTSIKSSKVALEVDKGCVIEVKSRIAAVSISSTSGSSRSSSGSGKLFTCVHHVECEISEASVAA